MQDSVLSKLHPIDIASIIESQKENEKLITLPVGVSRFRDALQTNWTGMLAGIVIASIPMVIAFLFGSKWFIRGLTAGGIKG